MPDSSELQDKLVTCVDCGAQFTISARDQAFYQERGYQAPRRCKTCRDKRQSGALPQGGIRPPAGAPVSDHMTPAATGAPARDQFKVQCSGCGVETAVSFKSDPNRPVDCRTCYINSKKK